MALLSSPHCEPAVYAGAPQPRPAAAPVRHWRVLHACKLYRDVVKVVEPQLAAGMQPSVVVPEGIIPAEADIGEQQQSRRQVSLLHLWHEVRHWRKVILDADAEVLSEILHAHSFPAGMAGVRIYPVVVYDLHIFVEEMPPPSAAQTAGPWLPRSLRVLDQFVLARASAVVIHSNMMRDAVLRRASAPENVFVIPEPVEILPARFPDSAWLQALRLPRRAVILFAPGVHVRADDPVPEELALILRGLHDLRTEAEEAHLLIEVEAGAYRRLEKLCADAGIKEAVRPLPPSQRDQALASADVVVVTGPGKNAGVSELRCADPDASTALAWGRPLLAADVPQIRDLTPEGRGCLWFRRGDSGDLAARAAFLVRNPDFRRALAIAGQRQLTETRSPAVVARSYDAVYRHAFSRRRHGDLSSPLGGLRPVQACW